MVGEEPATDAAATWPLAYAVRSSDHRGRPSLVFRGAIVVLAFLRRHTCDGGVESSDARRQHAELCHVVTVVGAGGIRTRVPRAQAVKRATIAKSMATSEGLSRAEALSSRLTHPPHQYKARRGGAGRAEFQNAENMRLATPNCQ